MEVIPKLQKWVKNSGTYDINQLETLSIDYNFGSKENVILEILNKVKPVTRVLVDGSIDIVYDRDVKEEGYKILIEPNKIKISVSSSTGALYAIQSIRILGEFDLNPIDLECGYIEDYPEYSWRGLLYDEARYFFGKDATKRLLDLMSLHKLNVLHWHLTDDPGWRIQIDKYPRLVEIGSKREGTQINGWLSTDIDPTVHEGYYTKDDIREIVKYAYDRGIIIVPEIDMPGHFAAASAAYSNLTCRDIKRPVPNYFGPRIPMSKGIRDWNRAACVANEDTMQFARDVIDEVLELFPAGYFHIGGDEAPTGEWKRCPKCQNLMKEKGFTKIRQLQSYFIDEIKKYVEFKGAKLIGWNEILKGDDPDNSIIVQYWTPKSDPKVKKHMNNGGDVIISKHKYFYFDMTYGQYPLKNTYKFSPQAMKFSDKQIEHIKGVEGALWSEWLPDVYKFDLHAFPRITALSEVAWNQGKKNYKEFKARLKDFENILEKLNLNYAEEPIRDNKNLFDRLHILRSWFRGNQSIELKRNNVIKKEKFENS